MREIVARGGEHSPINFYFPSTKTDIFNKYELEKDGYRPHRNCIICDLCLRKGVEHSVVEIDKTYIKIIRKLKYAGLLPKNYPLMCCNCYDKKNNSNR